MSEMSDLCSLRKPRLNRILNIVYLKIEIQVFALLFLYFAIFPVVERKYTFQTDVDGEMVTFELLDTAGQVPNFQSNI